MAILIVYALMTNVSTEIVATDFDGKVYLVGNIGSKWTQTFTPPQQMPNWPKTVGYNPKVRLRS